MKGQALKIGKVGPDGKGRSARRRIDGHCLSLNFDRPTAQLTRHPPWEATPRCRAQLNIRLSEPPVPHDAGSLRP